MAFCSECAAPNNVATKFCTSCGVAMVNLVSNSAIDSQNINVNNNITDTQKTVSTLTTEQSSSVIIKSKSNILIYTAICVLFFIAQSSIWIYRQHQAKISLIPSANVSAKKTKLENKVAPIQKQVNKKSTVNYYRPSNIKVYKSTVVTPKESNINTATTQVSKAYSAPNNNHVASTTKNEVFKPTPSTTYEPTYVEDNTEPENLIQKFIRNLVDQGSPPPCSEAEHVMHQCNY